MVSWASWVDLDAEAAAVDVEVTAARSEAASREHMHVVACAMGLQWAWRQRLRRLNEGGDRGGLRAVELAVVPALQEAYRRSCSMHSASHGSHPLRHCSHRPAPASRQASHASAALAQPQLQAKRESKLRLVFARDLLLIPPYEPCTYAHVRHAIACACYNDLCLHLSTTFVSPQHATRATFVSPQHFCFATARYVQGHSTRPDARAPHHTHIAAVA